MTIILSTQPFFDQNIHPTSLIKDKYTWPKKKEDKYTSLGEIIHIIWVNIINNYAT